MRYGKKNDLQEINMNIPSLTIVFKLHGKNISVSRHCFSVMRCLSIATKWTFDPCYECFQL